MAQGGTNGQDSFVALLRDSDIQQTRACSKISSYPMEKTVLNMGNSIKSGKSISY